MFIIGELINSSRKGIRALLEQRDADSVASLAKRQAECGAHAIDVNAGTLGGDEPSALAWACTVVQDATGLPVCIDSPSPAALTQALEVARGRPIISSITAEPERFDAMLGLARRFRASLIALCMDENGIPDTADGRMQVARKLVGRLLESGMALSDIYLDVMVKPVSVEPASVAVALEVIAAARCEWPGIHTTCGLSNVSFGLPERRLLNRAFASMAVARGLDSAILDPTDRALVAEIFAAEALAGIDEYCARYIRAYRAGRLAKGD